MRRTGDDGGRDEDERRRRSQKQSRCIGGRRETVIDFGCIFPASGSASQSAYQKAFASVSTTIRGPQSLIRILESVECLTIDSEQNIARRQRKHSSPSSDPQSLAILKENTFLPKYGQKPSSVPQTRGRCQECVQHAFPARVQSERGF